MIRLRPDFLVSLFGSFVLISSSLSCTSSSHIASNNATPDATVLKNAPREDPDTVTAEAQEKALVKRNGWLTLDKTKLETKQVRTEIEGTTRMFMTKYLPKSAMILSLTCDPGATLDRCEQYPLGQHYYIRELIVYDVRQKVFAVKTVVSPTDQDRSSSFLLLNFLDDDGDGLFETVLLDDGTDQLRVPAWIKK